MNKRIKVKVNSETMKSILAYQLEKAKEIAAYFNKSDEGYITVEDLKMAARCIGFQDGEILKAEAYVARNCRVYNQMSVEDSDDLDVWIDFYAFDEWSGFFEIGVYLSDIWNIAGDNKEEIASHMYVRKYTHTEEN